MPDESTGSLAFGNCGTADVVAEIPAALHRWFATTLAERLTDRTRALDTLLD